MANAPKVANFFKTKRPELIVGSVTPEGLEVLINTIKQAKAQGKSITFFLWKNGPREDGTVSKVVAGLTVGVDTREPQSSFQRRPIGNAGGSGTGRAPAKDALGGLFGDAPAKAEAAADEW